jgi:hypothetical protein
MARLNRHILHGQIPRGGFKRVLIAKVFFKRMPECFLNF